MNTTTAPQRQVRDLDDRETIDRALDLQHDVAWTDRLSLRLGMWLLLRTARRVRRAHDEHARTRDNALAREARETAAQRENMLRSIRA